MSPKILHDFPRSTTFSPLLGGPDSTKPRIHVISVYELPYSPLQLTFHTDYALRVFIYLMRTPDQVVSTREIAEHYVISLNHLIKVTKTMTQRGWLEATRGVGGGVRLAPSALDLKLGDLVSQTEHLNIVECFDLSTNTCPIHRGCQLKLMLYHAQRAFLQVLNQFTVRDLAKSPGEIKSVLQSLGLPAQAPSDNEPRLS